MPKPHEAVCVVVEALLEPKSFTMNLCVFTISMQCETDVQMRFHYIIRGPAAGVLTVNTRSTSDGAFKEIWRSDRPSEFFHFTEASVTFQEDEPFQVMRLDLWQSCN